MYRCWFFPKENLLAQRFTDLMLEACSQDRPTWHVAQKYGRLYYKKVYCRMSDYLSALAEPWYSKIHGQKRLQVKSIGNTSI